MKNRLSAVFYRVLIGALIITTFCAAPVALRATEYTVDDLTDSKPTLGGLGSGTVGDLRYCITQAGYGATGSTSTIEFTVTGTITLAGHELVINSDLTITGPGASSLTVDANNASRVLFVVSDHTVSISGLTLTDGDGVGNDATGFDTGAFDGDGGAILNLGVLTVLDCTISNSSNYKNGGGGGLCNLANGADATLALNGCTITGNSVRQNGGGIENYGDGGVATLSVDACTISNNLSTADSGGGIYNDGYLSAANATITGCTISGNSAGYFGGGICSVGSSSVSVTNSAISGNSLTSGADERGGGGLLNSGTSGMTLLNCTVTANISTTAGGGITNYSGTLTVSNCTISSNTAATTGGGIYNRDYYGGEVTVIVANSTISGNSAQQRGGGIYNYSQTNGTATALLNNTTISGNSAQQRGGGLDNYANDGTSAITIANSTISGNSALSGGAGIANDQIHGTNIAATVTLSNTILALNPNGANFGTAYGTAASGGFNLSDDGTCVAFLTAPGDLNNTAAGLQVDGSGNPLLQNNGGPTDTIALLPGSVAIDGGKAADDPVTGLPTMADQRGLLRPYDLPNVLNAAGGDGSDIGAFEFGSVAPAAPVINSPAAATGQAGVAFTYQITTANGATSFGATGLPTGLVLNPASGLISGTASVATVMPVAVGLSAANAGGSGAGTLTLTIQPAGPAPVVTSAASASGRVGVAFSYAIVGTHSPTSFAATSLPAGLSVNTSKGVISGTPTLAGFYNVTLSATNYSGTGSSPLALTIQPGVPSITSAGNAAGVVRQNFTYQITASNGPTSFGASGLPAGLSVNSTSGLISGAPTMAGTFPVSLSASNASGTGNAALALTVNPAPGAPVVTSATFSGEEGVVFRYQIIASNSPTSFVAGGLPAGLSVNASTGLITGTPSETGTFGVSLSASNGGGTGIATLNLTIAVGAPVITSATMATGKVSVPFSYQIIASNAPAVFAATGLPPGLVIEASTGLIAGTPTTAGSFSASLSASNTGGTGTATLTFTVSPAPQPTGTVTSPPPGLTFAAGASLPLATSIDDPAGIVSKVQFFIAGVLVATLPAPGPYVFFGTAPANAGTYAVEIVVTDKLGRQSTSTQSIVVVAPLPGSPLPTVAIVTDLNGRSLTEGSTTLISATAESNVEGQPLASVKFYANGVLIATLTGPGLDGVYEVPYTIPATTQRISIVAVATTKLGISKVTAPLAFQPVVAAGPPVPQIGLVNGVRLRAGEAVAIPVTGTNGTAAIAEVASFLNGNQVGSADRLPATFEFIPSISGTYVLTIIVTDVSGVSTVSAPIVVGALPTVALSRKGDGMAIEGREKGTVVFTRKHADLSAPLNVRYRLEGDAVNGVDYEKLHGSLVIPKGAKTARLKIKALAGTSSRSNKKVKIVLEPSLGTEKNYELGTTVKETILLIEGE